MEMTDPKVDYTESRFEHNIISDLKYLILPQEAKYKDKIAPYHMVNATNYKNSHYKDLKAFGEELFLPFDKINNEIYDLTLNKKDEELSLLFETQPILTKLGLKDIDKLIMLNHCPEKAKGTYFMMPFTNAVFVNNDTNEAFYKLIPAIDLLSEENTLEYNIKFKNKLGLSAKMFMDRPELKFSLAPDVRAVLDKENARSLDSPLIVNAKLDKLLAGQEVIDLRTQALQLNQEVMMGLLDKIYLKIPSQEFISEVFNYLLNGEVLSSVVRDAIMPLSARLGGLENGLNQLLGKSLSDNIKVDVVLDKGTDYEGSYVVGKEFEAGLSILSPVNLTLSKARINLPVSRAYSGINLLNKQGNDLDLNMKVSANHAQSITTVLSPDSSSRMYFQPNISGYAEKDGNCLPLDFTVEYPYPIIQGSVSGTKMKKIGKALFKVALGKVGTLVDYVKQQGIIK